MSLTCTYKTDGGDLVIEFDYEPAEPKTWDDPGCPESVCIVSVTAGQIDILEWCSEDSMEFFETKALESIAAGIADDEYDRGCLRAEALEAA